MKCNANRLQTRRLAWAGLACALALGISAAAGTPATAHAADKGGTATDYEWSIDLDCSTCHEKQYESLGLATEDDAAPGATETANSAQTTSKQAENGSVEKTTGDVGNATTKGTGADDLAEVTSYAQMHVQDLGLTCVSCHEDTDGLAKGHAKLNSGKEAKRLKKSEVSNEVCLSCHNQDDLAEATKGCTVLTDKNGTVVNPHALPDVADHDGITCTSCHAVHGTEDGVAAQAYATCTNCHHAEVFECNTCH